MSARPATSAGFRVLNISSRHISRRTCATSTRSTLAGQSWGRMHRSLAASWLLRCAVCSMWPPASMNVLAATQLHRRNARPGQIPCLCIHRMCQDWAHTGQTKGCSRGVFTEAELMLIPRPSREDVESTPEQS
eukprot:353350-Chlamydomonas_euryale.AAC.3